MCGISLKFTDLQKLRLLREGSSDCLQPEKHILWKRNIQQQQQQQTMFL